jgi:hypothetical protein
MNRATSHATSLASTLLLSLVLICAQWLGMHHRIAHGLHLQANGAVSSQFKSSGKVDLNHSCALFDAAAAGDLLVLPPCGVPLLADAEHPHFSAAWSSWDAPHLPYFSSRAPPSQG